MSTAALARLLCAALALAAPTGLAAQDQPAREAAPPRLILRAFTFEHQSASEALALVRPLLSTRGSVELQPGGNTLVIRDTLAALSRIAPVLRSFDHPPRPLLLDIHLVRATIDTRSLSPPSDLPESLVNQLKGLYRFNRYDEMARVALRTREGEEVSYRFGDGYEVSMRLGTLVGSQHGQRIKLYGFRIIKEPASQKVHELIHTTLNPPVGQYFTLGLATSELAHWALMVVLYCREDGAVPDQGMPVDDDKPDTGRG